MEYISCLTAFHTQMSEALQCVNSESSAVIDLESFLYSVTAHLKAFKVEHLKVLGLGLHENQHEYPKAEYQTAKRLFDEFAELVFDRLEQLGSSDTELDLISDVLVTIQCDPDLIPEDGVLKTATLSAKIEGGSTVTRHQLNAQVI